MAKPKRIHELGKVIIAAETYIVYKGNILMHKRSQTKKKFPGFWIGPGGHVDEGEDVLTAAIREVKEETGVIISEKNIKLKAIAIHHHLDLQEIFTAYIFLAHIPSYQKIATVTVEGVSAWISVPKLLKLNNVFPPSKYYFDHVLQDKSGIMYVNAQCKNSQITKIVSQRVDKNM